MTVKIRGLTFSGNGNDIYLELEMNVTCSSCHHSEIKKGKYLGPIKCPKCGCDSLSITAVAAPQQEVKQ